MYDELYTSMSPEERQYLKTNKQNISLISLSSKTEHIYNDALDWMAIYAPYFKRRNQYIKLTSSSYYYRTNDIDNYYPKNPDAEIRMPFNTNPREDCMHIHFIQTSTNAIIYEYADLLVEDGIFTKLAFANTLLVQHQKHKIQVLARPNLILVLTNEFNNRLLNETVAIIPSLFKLEDLLQNEKVMHCCRAVVNKQSIKEFFIDEFEAIANAEKEAFTNNLKELLTANKRKSLEEVTREIQNTRSRINDYEQTLDRLQESLQNQLNQKLGIECTLNEDAEGFKSLSNLLTKNKFIKEATFRRLNIGTGTKDLLSLEIEAPITLYEIEPLERTYNNMIDHWSAVGQAMLKAIKEVFTNDKYQLVCTTHVSMDPAAAIFSSGYGTLEYNLTNYAKMPQPHLTFYNCWGDANNNIKQALRKDCIEDAIQLMLISVRNINFTDSAVLRGWLDRLCYEENSLRYLKCVIDTEGNWYSLTDIYNLVLEKENENEEVQQPELIDELGGIE